MSTIHRGTHRNVSYAVEVIRYSDLAFGVAVLELGPRRLDNETTWRTPMDAEEAGNQQARDAIDQMLRHG